MDAAIDWTFIGVGFAIVAGCISATFAFTKISFQSSIDGRQAQIESLNDKLMDAGQSQHQLTMANRSLVEENSNLRAGMLSVSADPLVEELKAHLSSPNFDLWTFTRDALSNELSSLVPTIPIVSSINFKGGVGKTTFVSTLACYLAAVKKQRVLLVDIDYQGSLTNLFRRAWVAKEGRFPLAQVSKVSPGSWLSDDIGADEFIDSSFNVDALLPGCSVLETDYRFLALENRTYLRWAIDPSVGDARLRLRRLLADPYIGKTFDIVLIDCPPRLSLGAVNALVASSHFVVPTIFDRLSAEPIELLLAQVKELFPKDGAPSLLGVVGVRTKEAKNWSGSEGKVSEQIERTLRGGHATNGLFPNSLPNRVAFVRRAGMELAYQKEAEVREWTAPVGEEFLKRLRKSEVARELSKIAAE